MKEGKTWCLRRALLWSRYISTQLPWQQQTRWKKGLREESYTPGDCPATPLPPAHGAVWIAAAFSLDVHHLPEVDQSQYIFTVCQVTVPSICSQAGAILIAPFLCSFWVLLWEVLSNIHPKVLVQTQEKHRRLEAGSGDWQFWVWILPLAFISCVTLGKLLKLSVNQEEEEY